MGGLRSGDVVLVIFDDVQHQNKGWEMSGNWPERGKFLCVGVLLKQTKRSTYIAPVMDGSYSFCSYTIPTSSIRSMRRLMKTKTRLALTS